MSLDDGTRLSVTSIEAMERGEAVLRDLCENRGGGQVNGGSAAVPPPAFYLQGDCYWEERHGELSVLRETIPFDGPAATDGSAGVPVLQPQRVQIVEPPKRVQAVRDTRTDCRETTTAKGEVSQGRNRQGANSAGKSRVGKTKSRKTKSVQTNVSSEIQADTTKQYASVSDVREIRDTDSQYAIRQDHMPRMSAAASARTGEVAAIQETGRSGENPRNTGERENYDHAIGKTTCSEIVSIDYVGIRDVYDVETTEPHTIVFNGHARPQCQDMDPGHLPIIRECMSYSPYGIMQLAGTPKTLDNPLEGYWQQSSQAEWFIPCYACGRWNIPSREYDIDKMIGPVHEGISENCPGTICANGKCRRPIFPRHGRWVHKHKDRKHKRAGYHVPQIIMPLHYSRPDKWGELCAKRDGWGGVSAATFANEVLGESVDEGQRLISETELKAAATLPWTNNPDDPSPIMLGQLQHYKMRVMSVDWGGGGEDGVSFTVLTLLGLTPTNEIHVLWAKRLVLSQEHLKEAKEIKFWMQRFNCHLLVHDYTGAGVVRETILVQSGMPLDRIMPIQYVRAAASNLIRYVPATPLHNREHYRLDKTRSLLYTFQAIKTKLIKTFAYDFVTQENPGLLSDFLALVEEKKESRLSSDIYTITRNPLRTDDVAQAINIGCAALWHANDCWPDFAAAAAVARITDAQAMYAGHADYGWDQEPDTFFGY